MPFEKEALERLRTQVGEDQSALEYHQFSDEENLPVVRYARAQIMKENCVKCHNADEISPNLMEFVRQQPPWLRD